MSAMVAVRPYAPADRAAVRALACDTAERGEPVERFFTDREVAADLLTRYYLDYEPRAVWVADLDGRIVGYLTGCLDTRRYRRCLAWRILPQTVLKAAVRGTLWQPSTWRLMWDGAAAWLRRGRRRQARLAQYPAHLHVNVHRAFRGRHIGHRLIKRFLRQATLLGVRGVHVFIRSDNVAAGRLFEQLGFVRLSDQPAAEAADGRLFSSLIYGTRLGDPFQASGL